MTRLLRILAALATTSSSLGGFASAVAVLPIGEQNLLLHAGHEDEAHSASDLVFLLQRDFTRMGAGSDLSAPQVLEQAPADSAELSSWEDDYITDGGSNVEAPPAPEAVEEEAAPIIAAPTPAPVRPETPAAQQQRSSALLAGLVLFGLALFTVLVVCLVRPQPGSFGRVYLGYDAPSRKTCMAVVGYALAALCAEMLLWAIYSCWFWIATEDYQHKYQLPFIGASTGVLYVLLQLLLISFVSDPWALYAIGTVGGYLVGASLASLVGSIVSATLYAHTTSTLVMAIVMAIFMVIFSSLRDQVHGSFSERMSSIMHQTGWEHWRQQCRDSDAIAAGVALGYLLFQLVSFGVTGKLLVSQAAGYAVPTDDLHQLGWILLWAAVSTGLSFAIVLTIGQREAAQEGTASGKITVMLEHMVEYAMIMCLGWCSFSAVEGCLRYTRANDDALYTLLQFPWHFDAAVPAPEGFLIAAAVAVALGTTLVVVLVSLAIIAADSRHSDGLQLHAILLGLGAITGKAWSMGFVLAAAAFTEVFAYGHWISFGLVLALAFFLYPALYFYVMPHSQHKKWMISLAAEVVEDKAHGMMRSIESHIPGMHRTAR